MFKKRVLNLRRRNLFLLLLAIMIICILFLIFYSELKEISYMFILNYGYWGLLLIVVIMDFIIQPISPDIIVFGATLGGSGLLIASLIGGLGSCLAGVMGYTVGNKVGHEKFKEWFGAKNLKKGEKLFKKYGVWAVVIGAFSPIPYSSVCWSAGIYGMDFNAFLLTSLLTRIPRFFIVGLVGYMI